MVWRHRMDDFLQLIDRGRRDSGIFSLCGSTGAKRIRATPGQAVWPTSTRDAMEALPYVFYDEEWFVRIGADVRQATLHISREEFQWFQLFDRS